MKINSNGVMFIKKWEGGCLTSYLDTGGVWTIGYGHTLGVTTKQTITQVQAERFLLDDLQSVEPAINDNIIVFINQNQFDALASFTFNLERSALINSTLIKRLNQTDYQGAALEFPKLDHDNGKVVQGLLNRRLAEQALFLS